MDQIQEVRAGRGKKKNQYFISHNNDEIIDRQSIGQNYMVGVRQNFLLFLIHSFPQNKFTDQGFSTVVIMPRLC